MGTATEEAEASCGVLAEAECEAREQKGNRKSNEHRMERQTIKKFNVSGWGAAREGRRRVETVKTFP
jgi:hypothetical protein